MDTPRLRDRRALLSIAIAASIGDVAWCGIASAIALSLMFPPLCLLQRSRVAAYAVALGYYSGASWPLIPGARVFFGHYASIALAVVLWIAASAVLSAPWALLWANSDRARLWRGPLALIISAVPPIGIIGWASPLSSAGVLFPGSGGVGLASVLILSGSLAVFPRGSLFWAVLAASAANLIYPGDPQPLATSEAVDTQFGGAGFGARDPLADFTAAQWIQARALQSRAQVIVFPESAVPWWNEATEMFWEPTLALLKASEKTIVLGAGISQPGTKQFENMLVIRGAQNGPDLPQRIPVPIGMWRPLGKTGVPLHIAGAGVVKIAGQGVAVLICYEQLLVWPVLMSALDRPALILGISNDYWATGTRIPVVQHAALRTWARLFGLPHTTAINS